VSLLSALSLYVEVCPSAKGYVMALERGELGDAQSGLDGEVEQGLVPSPCPGPEVTSAE
jgi:hypothetical protein